MIKIITINRYAFDLLNKSFSLLSALGGMTGGATQGTLDDGFGSSIYINRYGDVVIETQNEKVEMAMETKRGRFKRD